MKTLNIYFTNRIVVGNLGRLLKKLMESTDNGYTQINVILASSGGKISDALLFYKHFKKINFKEEICVYNACNVASAAVVVYLAFPKRYIIDNSYFMIHSARNETTGAIDQTAIQLNQDTGVIVDAESNIDIPKYTAIVNSGIDKYFDVAESILEGLCHHIATAYPNHDDSFFI